MLAEESSNSFLIFDIVPCRSHATHCSSMSARGDIASTSTAGKGQKGGRIEVGVSCTCPKKPIELLSKPEFRERFRIPNDISVHLMDDVYYVY